MSFLQHLEALRWHLVRSVIAIVLVTIIVFINKYFVFDNIILGPKNLDFLTYKFLCLLSEKLHIAALCIKKINFTVINIELAGQFLLHLKSSFILGFILAFPYIFWEIWRFVKPALYDKEKTYARGIVFYCSILFLFGVLFGYYILTPFSINFLGSYNVSEEVGNKISLTSYVGTISSLVLVSGIIFELPIVVYFLSKLGIVSPKIMRKYRRHALVAILLLSGVITPPDLASQVLIAFPLYGLYEMSIFISAKVSKKDE